MKAIRFLLGRMAKAEGPLEVETASVNGRPVFLVRISGDVDGTLEITLEQGQTARVYSVRNPAKLTRLQAVTPLALR